MIIVFFSTFGQVQCLQEPAIRIWHEPAPIVTALALLRLSCAKNTSVSAQMFQSKLHFTAGAGCRVLVVHVKMMLFVLCECIHA